MITVRFCRARTRTHMRTHACMPHHAVLGWHARSIIGMRDLQAAAARICICEGGRGDCRQILPRAHSHTRAHAHACTPTALCRDSTRGASSACAICKLLLRAYAYARGGGVIAVRSCRARTRTHARTRTLARPPRGAGIARAEHHRHARSASCCCEHMRMRGGEG